MLVAGVDEAGRGPVLGPLVVAAVATDDLPGLEAVGVKDSKALRPVARGRLALAMRPYVRRAKVLVIPAAELDRRMTCATLNEIEAEAFATALDAVAPDAAYLDAADVDEARFGRRVAGHMERKARIVARHKADVTYPVVSAASILAKVTRDAEIERIAEALGADVGSGYPSDPKTRTFLEEYVKTRGDLPPHARRMWATSKALIRTEKTIDVFS